MTVRLMKAGAVGLLAADTAQATNAQATVAYGSPGSGLYHIITEISWSYNGAPAQGFLQILDGPTVVFDLDITVAGANSIQFVPPKCGSHNTSMTVLLGAGGAGVTGKLNVGHWIG